MYKYILITFIIFGSWTLINSGISFYGSLLGSASLPLNNLVRSKSNSLDTEVDLVDGQQSATPVSFIYLFNPILFVSVQSYILSTLL